MIIAVNDLQKKVLTQLMNLEVLNDYFLVGGTNLALRENHRKSTTLDLFVKKDFNLNQNNYIDIKLKSHFGARYINTQISEVGVFGKIDGIKINLVNFPYSFTKPIEKINNYRLASKIDVAAMKINAIAGKGSKKDFYDIDKLLKSYSLKEMFHAYQLMFKIDNILHAEKSLVYFNDANDTSLVDNKIISLENKSWEEVKNNIISHVRDYRKEILNNVQIKN